MTQKGAAGHTSRGPEEELEYWRSVASRRKQLGRILTYTYTLYTQADQFTGKEVVWQHNLKLIREQLDKLITA